MLDAVFISDLHLHPNEELIHQRFQRFIKWAQDNQPKCIYILGDFLHAWAGDDTINEWSLRVANKLNVLARLGVNIFFMHGNRDFLIGKQFTAIAGMKLIPDPTVIQLGTGSILLTHGDRYCTQDKTHQYFRKLTRNSLFTSIFLLIPKQIRQKMVNKVRQHSQTNRSKTKAMMAIEPLVMLAHMEHHQVKTIIHGHTHQPSLTKHTYQAKVYEQYILSDWDDKPQVLCYHRTKGFYYSHI